MPESPTIFMSIAAYREQRGARTIASAFANAKYPQRLFVGLYQQRDPDKDPDGLNFTDYCHDPPKWEQNAALCTYGPTHTSKVEVHWTQSEGPCVARAKAEQMYGGQDFVFQIDAHSTFVPDWDAMMLRMWAQTNNEFAVLSGYPRSEGQLGQSNFRNLPMICTARMLDWSVRDMLKNTAGDSPMRPHPVRTPYFGAGLVFSKGHRLAAVPYDPYLHYLFDGEEFDMAMRLFTSGYDIYAPNETPLFHIYSSPAENKRMGIAKFWVSEIFRPRECAQCSVYFYSSAYRHTPCVVVVVVGSALLLSILDIPHTRDNRTINGAGASQSCFSQRAAFVIRLASRRC